MQLNVPYSYSFRTLVRYWITAIVLLLMLLFVVFQARFLIVGPRIVITDAPEGPQNQRQITISGTAYNISHLWLNDRAIYTDAKGNFKETIVLENGYTIATLRAEDRYGRTTKTKEELVFIPASFVPSEGT
ncbi:MAG: hypothetical protein KBB78_01965 [Candidatus Pacebacteria bacterium]|nr:hypothetical protein [Candidatus Paceibacterota bacterium]